MESERAWKIESRRRAFDLTIWLNSRTKVRSWSTVWLNVFLRECFARLAAIFWKTLCLRRFKLLFVYLALGLPAGLIGIPYSFVVSDISLLYRVAMWIANAGVRAAGIRVEIVGLENVPAGEAVHLHVQPCLEPGSAGVASAAAGAQFGAAEERVDEHPDSGAGDEDGEVRARGARGSQGRGAGKRGGGYGCTALGAEYSGLSGGDALAGWAALAAFKKGPFFLAQQTEAPIVPIALSGTQNMMHKGSTAIVPGVARMQVLAGGGAVAVCEPRGDAAGCPAGDCAGFAG